MTFSLDSSPPSAIRIARGIGLATVFLMAGTTRAQDVLAPAVPLAESDIASVLPTSINDDGTIAGTRILSLPPLPNCNAMCQRGRLSDATGAFLTRAGAPLTMIAGQRPVAINRTHVAMQESGGPASPPIGARLIHLGTREVSYAPQYSGRSCLLRDLDDRGQLLCGFTDPTAVGLVPTTSFLVDVATRAVTPLLCPGSVPSYACTAVAMNDAGLIAGTAAGPVIWESPDSPIPLPTSARFRTISVVAVNERGTILGSGEDHERRRWVLFWDAPTRALHVFGEGVGVAINDHDVVAGHTGAEPRATLFDLRSGRAIVLPGITGDERTSEALDINNHGVAIGRADTRGVVFAAYP